LNNTQISFSWYQPVLSNEGGEVSCSRKQQEPLIGFKLTSIQLLQVWHCAMWESLLTLYSLMYYRMSKKMNLKGLLGVEP